MCSVRIGDIAKLKGLAAFGSSLRNAFMTIGVVIRKRITAGKSSSHWPVIAEYCTRFSSDRNARSASINELLPAAEDASSKRERPHYSSSVFFLVACFQ